MTNLAHELALLTCRQCSIQDGESEVDFSTRLYSVYNSCLDNVQALIDKDLQPSEEYMRMLDNML